MSEAEIFDMVHQNYHDAFGVWFPTMCFQDESLESMTKMMEKCISEGVTAEELYNIDYDEDINY